MPRPGWTDDSLSSEELHPQQGEDYNEEEEEEEQADDGLHGVEQRHDKVTQRSPVPGKNKQKVFFSVQCYVFEMNTINDQNYNTVDSLGDFEDPQ